MPNGQTEQRQHTSTSAEETCAAAFGFLVSFLFSCLPYRMGTKKKIWGWGHGDYEPITVTPPATGAQGQGAQPARQLVWGLEPRVASQRHHHTTRAEKQRSVTDSRSRRVSLGCPSCLPASRQLPAALPDVLNVVRQCLGTAASNSQSSKFCWKFQGKDTAKEGTGMVTGVEARGIAEKATR